MHFSSTFIAALVVQTIERDVTVIQSVGKPGTMTLEDFIHSFIQLQDLHPCLPHSESEIENSKAFCNIIFTRKGFHSFSYKICISVAIILNQKSQFQSFFAIYRKIPIISPRAYICSRAFLSYFLDALYGILGEGLIFGGGVIIGILR